MKANVKGASLRQGAFNGYLARAHAEQEIDRVLRRRSEEMERARMEEIEKVIFVIEETVLYTLHEDFGFGKDRLHKFWKRMVLNRVDARNICRDGLNHYEIQPTGENMEDYGIHAELLKVGVDLDKWYAEDNEEIEEALNGGKRK